MHYDSAATLSEMFIAEEDAIDMPKSKKVLLIPNGSYYDAVAPPETTKDCGEVIQQPEYFEMYTRDEQTWLGREVVVSDVYDRPMKGFLENIYFAMLVHGQ